jgi:uncharacterized membrane protein
MTGYVIKERFCGENKFITFLFLLTFAQFMFLSFHGFSRHFNYLSSINDLGHFDQAIWGFLKGIPFLNTDTFSRPTSRLGVHFDPILALFVPFYVVKPSVGWLILAQSFALSFTAWPIFFLAKRIFHSDKVAFLWPVIFAFNAFTLNAAAWDFHPVTLAVPFIALSYLAVEKKCFKLLVMSCVFILLCKEHFGLMVICFAFLWALKNKEWKKPILLIFVGLAHVVLVFYVIMPYYSPTGKHLMFSYGQGQLSRYAWLGSSPWEIIAMTLKNPLQVFGVIFKEFNGGLYLLALVLPLLFFPIAGIEFLLPGMADLVANMLSANQLPRSVFSYHSATLVPVFTVAAMYGVKRAIPIITKFSALEMTSFVLIPIFIFGWLFFPFFQLPGSVNVWKAKRIFNFHEPVIQKIHTLLREDISLTIQANVGPHFTHRHEIYMYPNNVGQVDAVVLRLESPTWLVKERNPGSVASLAHHLQMDPIIYLESIKGLLALKTHHIVLWEDPWLVLSRGEGDSKDWDSVEKKLNELESTWK